MNRGCGFELLHQIQSCGKLSFGPSQFYELGITIE